MPCGNTDRQWETSGLGDRCIGSLCTAIRRKRNKELSCPVILFALVYEVYLRCWAKNRKSALCARVDLYAFCQDAPGTQKTMARNFAVVFLHTRRLLLRANVFCFLRATYRKNRKKQQYVVRNHTAHVVYIGSILHCEIASYLNERIAHMPPTSCLRHQAKFANRGRDRTALHTCLPLLRFLRRS